MLMIVAFFAAGCATIFSNNVHIKGKVRLSDNPVSGHGGVRVSTDLVSTVSQSDGSFTIEGSIEYDEESFYMLFEKAGYRSVEKLVTAKKPEKSKDIDIDLGTVTLSKL